MAVTWLSGAIFGAYILLFFGGVALQGRPEIWNESLPHLHDATNPLATIAIGLHFVTGGVLLVLGPVQLVGAIRRSVLGLHRWLDRIYVCCAGLAGIGGLGFIMSTGTIGGPVMSTGFTIYGTLMTLAAVQTYTSARAGRHERHRAWAIRLFALTVGSWLYRMEYALWLVSMGRLGHSGDFSGWFDGIMAFFFYLPNLIVAQGFIRARSTPGRTAYAISATTVLLLAAMFVTLATWTFATRYWLPHMIVGISGAS